MNRLQKKCILGTAGIHLLLLTILIFGPAFFNRQPKVDSTVLDVIPANLVDAALNSGVQGAHAPPPSPPATPISPSLLRPPPAPEPKAVQPPAPTPSPSLLEAFKKYFSHTETASTVTPDLKRVEKPEKSHVDNIQVNLTKVRRRDILRSSRANNASNAREINSALNTLKASLSSSTKIDMPGNATAAYANYASVVQSVYEQHLLAHPEQAASNNESTKVSVTIANDGTVISARIISTSGDSAWDQTVQNTLDDVKFIARFPDGATDRERHYVLTFYPHE
ncbi:MAG: TonB family protein [Limisphaerales bacterium]